VLLKVPHAERAADAARAAGIAWRRFPGRPGMEDLVRITLPGDPVAFARLRAVCESVLADTEGSS
jgi:hypothetical protein